MNLSRHTFVQKLTLILARVGLLPLQLSHTSVDYMTVYRDATAHTQSAISESVASGRNFLETCAQLDERMRGVEAIAAQLADVDRALSALELACAEDEVLGLGNPSASGVTPAGAGLARSPG